MHFHLLRLALARGHMTRMTTLELLRRTILKLLSSSLICCASMGVRRLHVAISERRSYSWLGHVSWKTIRGLNVALRLLWPP